MDIKKIGTKERKCLGINCEEKIEQGKYFCPRCKAKKNSIILSKIETPIKVISDKTRRNSDY